MSLRSIAVAALLSLATTVAAHAGARPAKPKQTSYADAMKYLDRTVKGGLKARKAHSFAVIGIRSIESPTIDRSKPVSERRHRVSGTVTIVPVRGGIPKLELSLINKKGFAFAGTLLPESATGEVWLNPKPTGRTRVMRFTSPGKDGQGESFGRLDIDRRYISLSISPPYNPKLDRQPYVQLTLAPKGKRQAWPFPPALEAGEK